jgi:hypothetical protein
MLFFVSPRQSQVRVGRLLRLLYEAVQQDHSVLAIDIEQNAGNAIVREIRADLVDSLTQRPANWHSDRPAEFDRLDVLSNSFPMYHIWYSCQDDGEKRSTKHHSTPIAYQEIFFSTMFL